jgi:uncharacterized DUF497 family protein
MIQFEWDHDKAATNHKKHGVYFEEAATVFYDPLSATFDIRITLWGNRG